MDPNANLEEQLRLVADIQRVAAQRFFSVTAKATRLAELVAALHGWIANGGALPTAWQSK